MMLYVVYELNFGKGLRYVGITSDFNQRLETHRKYWKQDGLKIKSVKIVHYGSEAKCRKVESKLIREDETGLLMNKSMNNTPVDLGVFQERMYDDIPTPLEVLESAKKAKDKVALLRKRLSKLENRYITVYMQLQRMKNNIDYLDEIVEEATLDAVRNSRRNKSRTR